MRKVWELYAGNIGDDCSMVGIVRRESRTVTLLTGPPLERSSDEAVVRRFLSAPGRHVVCGGTTGNIVGRYLDEQPETDISSMRPGVPPIAHLREVDLLTEGILTMSKAVERLRAAAGGAAVPQGNSGDLLLAHELLAADHVHILLGQRINDAYQSPRPPRVAILAPLARR